MTRTVPALWGRQRSVDVALPLKELFCSLVGEMRHRHSDNRVMSASGQARSLEEGEKDTHFHKE